MYRWFKVLKQLNFKHNQAPACHAENQGALEQFHQTLKSFMCAYCIEMDGEWEEGLLLLAGCQESIGFRPNDLVFSHIVWGPLAVLQDEVGRSLVCWKTYGVGWNNKKLLAYVMHHNTTYEYGRLDDGVIFSNTWEDRMSRIHALSECVADGNLKLGKMWVCKSHRDVSW